MESSPIRIGLYTKERLTKLKKKYGTYDAIVSTMLDYFDRSGISPNEASVNPTNKLENRIEYLISQLKGVENKTLTPLVRKTEYLIDKIENINSQKSEANTSNNDDDLLSKKESEEVAKMVLDLEEIIKRKNEEILNLNKRIIEEKEDVSNEGNNAYELVFEDIKKEVQKFEIDGKKGTTFNNKDFIIPYAKYISIKNTIINLIENR